MGWELDAPHPAGCPRLQPSAPCSAVSLKQRCCLRSAARVVLRWEQTLPTGMGRDGASDLPAVWQLLLRRCFSVALDGTGTALLAAGRTLLTMNSRHVWSSESGWQ